MIVPAISVVGLFHNLIYSCGSVSWKIDASLWLFLNAISLFHDGNWKILSIGLRFRATGCFGWTFDIISGPWRMLSFLAAILIWDWPFYALFSVKSKHKITPQDNSLTLLSWKSWNHSLVVICAKCQCTISNSSAFIFMFP